MAKDKSPPPCIPSTLVSRGRERKDMAMAKDCGYACAGSLGKQGVDASCSVDDDDDYAGAVGK